MNDTPALVILAVALTWLVASIVARTVLYQPRSPRSKSGPITRMTREGVSYVFFDRGSTTTVVVSHGNAGNALDWASMLTDVWPSVNICVYDYFNYGKSLPTPGGVWFMTSSSLTRAADSMMKTLLRIRSNDKFIAMGVSLGSHPTCYLASNYPTEVVKVVLIVPFDSLWSLTIPGVPLLVGSHDNLQWTPTIHQPVLMFRGRRDTLCPEVCTRNLGRALTNSMLVTLECGHNGWSKMVGESKDLTEFLKLRD
jgi:pimeloyl-ACP methyl ester carboxylesterase